MDLRAEAAAWGDSTGGLRNDDLERLIWMGERLDFYSAEMGGETLGMRLARALLRVRNRQGRIVPLEANATQRMFEQRRGQRNIVLKARQMGISTWVAGRFFLRTITRPGTLTVEVAHNRDAAEQIFRIVHRFYEQLPEGLREGVLRVSRSNSGQLLFPVLDSEYRVESAADVNAGRGMTVQNLHCSEVARWGGDAAATLASLNAALVPDGEVVLESTPNGAHGSFYDEWRRAEETGTVQHFFPWWMERAYVGPAIPPAIWSEEERALAEEHGLVAEQIGFRRRLRANFRQAAAQEYAEDAEECFVASGNCVFDLERIGERARAVHDPMEKRRNGRLWIWYPPLKSKRYLVAADPAGGGTDGDYAALQVIELQTGLQCAELQERIDPRELARQAVELAREYNDALLVVERNNHGAAVLAYMDHVKDCPPIYEQRGVAGWLTTAMSRPGMIEHLGMALIHDGGILSSVRLLAECRTFVRQMDGRVEAAAGGHDDCVMAMAMAMAVRAEIYSGW
ncbi:MAG: terminase [Acidobacteriaceae bacterium]